MDASENKVSTETRTTRWASHPWMRKAWTIYLVAVLAFLAYVVLTSDGLNTSTAVTGSINVVVGVGWLWITRMRASAGADGIMVVRGLTRRAGWQDIDDVLVEGKGQWSTKVAAKLTDGTVLDLTYVPPLDIADGLKWRPSDERREV